MDGGAWWATVHGVTKRQDRATSLSLSLKPYLRASLIAQLVKNLPAIQETGVRFLRREDPLEKALAAHSSILAWRIPRGARQAAVHRVARVRHDLATKLLLLLPSPI